jgi:murein DD-endopeptidase MepM/ murein hydrolase activator NlpD
LSYQDKISGITNSVIKTPEGYTVGKPEVIKFSDDYFDCSLFAKSFAQGNAVYGELLFKGRDMAVRDAVLSLKGEKVPLTATAWGYRFIAAIHPEQKPGKIEGVVTYTVDGKTKSLRVNVSVKDVKYPVSTKKLDLGKFSDESYYRDPEKMKFIKECEEVRAQAFKSDTADSITNSLSHPRDFHKITGAYWNKRIYLSYEKKKNGKMVKSKSRVSFHRGVDLKGPAGTPVYAMADGLVVLSQMMFFEGNMVVVDHGNKVFSYYMHMDSRGVKTGDRVRAGQQIGKVGSTGTSTGPHLHVALSIRGVHVDPLSLLWLPVSL